MLTDQEITNNFNTLIKYYLEINNILEPNYNAEQKENSIIVITQWNHLINQPTYETFRNYNLDQINTYYMNKKYCINRCKIVSNTLFKGMYHILINIGNQSESDAKNYLVSVSGLSLDQLNEILD